MQSTAWPQGGGFDPDPGRWQDTGKFSYVEEGLYAHDDTVTAVTVGDKTYRVRRVDDEIRNENAY